MTETIEIPEGSRLRDDGLFVIADARTGSSDQTNVPDADMIDNFDPQNGPDCMQLFDAKGELLDAVGYGAPLIDIAENGSPCYEGSSAEDVGSDWSLSRFEENDSDDNAVDFLPTSPPTPGTI